MKDDETVISRKKADVTTRLNELGVSEAWLRSAIEGGSAEANRCTKNDAKTARGFYRWNGASRELRRSARKDAKWKREDGFNLPIVVSPDRSVALTVSAGNEAVGTDSRPRTTGDKGIATKLFVWRNAGRARQAQFNDVSESFPRTVEHDAPPHETWVLLYYVDEETGQTRFELSLPTAFDDADHIVGWGERLVLDPIGHTPEPLADADDDDDKYEASVRKKAN